VGRDAARVMAKAGPAGAAVALAKQAGAAMGNLPGVGPVALPNVPPGIPKGGPGAPAGERKGLAPPGAGKGGGPGPELIEKGNPFGINPAEGVGELVKLMKGVHDTLLKIEKKPGAEIEPANL
jgi:hypothetical protein